MTKSIEEILVTEFDPAFVEKMKERMIISFYKYGPLAEGFPHKVNAVASLQDRLRKYAETKNTEFLVDAANFAMIEFMFPSLDGAHFRSTDSDESPGRRSNKGTKDTRDNKEIGEGATTRIFRG